MREHIRNHFEDATERKFLRNFIIIGQFRQIIGPLGRNNTRIELAIVHQQFFQLDKLSDESRHHIKQATAVSMETITNKIETVRDLR